MYVCVRTCVCVCMCVCVMSTGCPATRKLNLGFVLRTVVCSGKRYKCEGEFNANPVRCEARLLSVSHRFHSSVG